MLEAQRLADQATQPFDFGYEEVPRYVELKADIFQRLAKALHAKTQPVAAAEYYQKAIDKELLLYNSDKLLNQRPRHGNRLAQFYIRRAKTLEGVDVEAARRDLQLAIEILMPLTSDVTNDSVTKSSELLTQAQAETTRLAEWRQKLPDDRN